MNVEENCNVGSTMARLGWPDYCVFVIMLIFSSAVGLFYGVYRKKDNTTNEYFLSSRQMHFFPAAMSLVNSVLSAVLILGIPSEMYMYGTQYSIIMFSMVPATIIASYLYVPVFRQLGLTSSYKYLKLRFNNYICLLASGMFIIQNIFYSPISAYTAGLALNQVAGWNINISVGIIITACVIYTALGGIKTVIWTDTVQGFLVYFCQIALLVGGLVEVGGFSTLWQRNENSGRIEFFNMNPDPTIRHTFWSVAIGRSIFGFTYLISSQGAMQRCLSTKTVKGAQKAVMYFGILKFLLYIPTILIGLLIYAKYYNCDPLLSQKIAKSDQIVPFFMMDVMGHYPGFPGLFIGGILCATLSTLSTIFNSLATITMEDFVASKWRMPEEKVLRIAKWVSALYGLIVFGVVFVIPYLGTINQLMITVSSMVCGTTGGLFTLGMFYPWCNSKGASSGVVVSMIFVCWIAIKAQLAREEGLIVYPKKPVSVDGCMCNETLTSTPTTSSEGYVFPLYKLSYLWLCSLGMMTTIVVGLAVSFFTKFEDPKTVNPDLLSPGALLLFTKLPKRIRTILHLPEYKCKNKDYNIPEAEAEEATTPFVSKTNGDDIGDSPNATKIMETRN